MRSIIRLVAVVAGLFLPLNITPSWGQPVPVCATPGCNPTTSAAKNDMLVVSLLVLLLPVEAFALVPPNDCRARCPSASSHFLAMILCAIR